MTTVIPAAAGLPLPTAQPRRRRRWRRWLIGLGACLLLAPALAWLYLWWSDDANVERAIAATDQLDPRWRWADILADRPAIADEQNSALVVARVMKLHGRPSFAFPQTEFEALQQALPTAPLTPDQARALRTLVSGDRKALIEARKLRDFPLGRPRIVYRPAIINTTIQPVQDAREVCALLCVDAALRTDDGDSTGAFHSCEAMLNAGRSIGDEPFAIALAVRMTCVHLTVNALERVLAHGQLDAAALEKMQAALERELAEPTLLTALRGERAGHFQLLQQLCGGELRRSQLAASIGLRQPELIRLFGDYVPPRVTYDPAAHLKRMNSLVEAAKLPLEQQPAEFERLMDEIGAVDVIEMLPFIWFQGSIFEYHRAQANLRCAIVALAAERYRLRHAAWPASLSVLAEAGLLQAVPLDPYSGKAVQRVQPAGRLIVYSIGPDRCDDGGNVVRHALRTVGQRHQGVEGTDQGFRLWDVNQRGR